MNFWQSIRRSAEVWAAPLILMIVGCGVVSGYVSAEGNWKAIWAGILLACCSAAVGVFLGFLFGVPRALTSAEVIAGAAGGTPSSIRRYAGNTNLEQISDWLTKAIVAVGLVEAHRIVRKVDEFAVKLAPFLQCGRTDCQVAAASQAVLVIGILFVIIGFLGGFLWARLFLIEQFRNADDAALETAEYYEGLMHAYLYRKPDGYRQTIRVSQEYKAKFDEFTGRMYLYLACAYAQQYSRLNVTKTQGDEELKRIRSLVMDYADKAMSLEWENRGLIKSLWKPGSGDDPNGDFVIFADDPEFTSIMTKHGVA
jgi:hypothetical protein